MHAIKFNDPHKWESYSHIILSYNYKLLLWVEFMLILLFSSIHNHHGMRSAVECTCYMLPPVVPLEQLPGCFCQLHSVFLKHGLLFQAELARWCGIQVCLLCWDACIFGEEYMRAGKRSLDSLTSLSESKLGQTLPNS